jgi:iron(III) transport system substrate-binding protein
VDKSPDRQAHLEAGAKTEGSLNWYTSLAGDSVQALVEGFNELYPWIKVNVYRADGNDVVTRITQEAQAGKHTVDIAEVTSASGLQLKDDGILADFYSPEIEKIPDQYLSKTKNGLVDWATDELGYIALGYNKTKVPADAVPKTVTDLLNPGLKGRFSIELTSTGVRWLGGVLHVLGDQKGEEFLRSLVRDQAPRAQEISGAAMMGLIASGEVGVGPAFLTHATTQKDKGAPVDWIAVSPVIANQGVEMVFKNAPHPNAAMLFMDYALGAASDPVWKKFNYSRPGVQESFTAWSPEAEAGSLEVYNANFTKWQKMLKELFG